MEACGPFAYTFAGTRGMIAGMTNNENVQELIARARLRIDPHRVMSHVEEMAFALGYESANSHDETHGIDESNWGVFAAVVLEAEAAHWQAEYDQLTNHYGSYRATKARAAWKLGATMLLRRAGQYRKDDAHITTAIK